MSLTPEETAFAELVEGCKLPELTRRELLERFLVQSLAVVSLAREVALLREFEANIRGALAARFAAVAPAPLRLVRDEAKAAFDAAKGRGE